MRMSRSHILKREVFMMKCFARMLPPALLALVLMLSCVACDNTPPAGTETDPAQGVTTDTNGEVITDKEAGNTSGAQDTSGTPDTPATPTTIKLTFNGTTVSGAPEGTITVDNNSSAFVIVKAGTYELTGDLSNGQVRVQVAKTEKVTLILNNFTASSSTTAPLYIASADKCTIELAAGSVNRLTDAATYVYADPTETKPNACLYSSEDLTIKGSGSLIVQGNYNNGIGSKNDLEIKSGTITVTAPNNIVKGGDSVTISGGSVTLSGGEDAIKTDSERQDKGFVLISEDAKVDITCMDDAIQATQSVTVESTARITYAAAGDAVNCPGVINVAEGSMTAK